MFKKTKRGGHPRFHSLLEEIADLHDLKNRDYADGMREGPLGNFYRTAEIKRLYPGFDWESPFGTAIDYALKQFDAGMVLRATGKTSVTGEPIHARLKDVAVYMLLAMVLLEEEGE